MNKKQLRMVLSTIIPDCHSMEFDLLIEWLIKNKELIPEEDDK